MTLKDAFLLLFRRWPITLLGLLFTALLGIGAFQVTSIKYTMTDQLVVVPSNTEQSAGQTLRVNPYTRFDGSNRISAEILSRTLNDASIGKAVDAIEPGATYAISVLTTTSAPILGVDVIVTNPKDGAKALDLIDAKAAQKLTAIQTESGAAPDSQQTLLRLPRSNPVANTKAAYTPVGGAAVVGIVVTVGLVVLVEARSRRRARPLGGAGAANGDAPALDAPAPNTPALNTPALDTLTLDTLTPDTPALNAAALDTSAVDAAPDLPPATGRGLPVARPRGGDAPGLARGDETAVRALGATSQSEETLALHQLRASDSAVSASKP